jgi:hypothetical protein
MAQSGHSTNENAYSVAAGKVGKGETRLTTGCE